MKFILGDAAEEETVRRAVADTVGAFGRIDLLVNNAGIAHMNTLGTATSEQWDRMMEVNLRAQFLTVKYCGEVMKKQGFGSIVNISSISGLTGGSTGPDYAASKAGVLGLTRYAARELGPFDVRVNAVAPGTIATDMIRRSYDKLTPQQREQKLAAIPMGRMGSPEEVGRVVLFLASDMSSYVSGEIIGVTGARTT